MRAYAYIAYSDAGRKKSGTVVAESETHAADMLKAQGLFVSELSDKGKNSGSRRLEIIPRGRLNADLQSVFTRQMAVLLAADLPAEAALEAVRAGAGNTALDAAASRAKAALLDGQPLSVALDESGAGFARYMIAAIRAGESAGDVATVFDELADHMETVGEDKAQISTALIYPGFVATVAFLVCAILMTTVAPEIVSMFELSDRPLPELTRTVLAISGWIETHLVALGVGLAGVVAFLIATTRIRWLRDRRDRALLRLPLIGRLMRLSASVQYLRTLALVLTSRHAVLVAVENASGVLEITRFKTEGLAVAEAVKGGAPLSEALQQLSFIPPVARQLIAAGEISARIARMAERSAVLVENGLSTERKRIAALLEPLLMILVGGFVLLIVLAVLLPIFDLQAVVAG